MKKPHNILSPISITIFLISCLPLILGQQPYIGNLIEDCNLRDNTSSVLGYTCNGLRRSCQAYLTFRARTPYNSAAAIAALLAANTSQLARLNSVSENAVLESDRVVLVPVTCSCSGQLYQANASYTVQSDDTYLIIANNTFQGLSTCQALQAQNNIAARDLFAGARLSVPLRCACPTETQIGDGVNYLLSYVVTWNQFVETISQMFGVDWRRTTAANSMSAADVVYPFTTLLIPLEDPPTSPQVTAPQPPPPPPPPPPATPSGGGSSKTWIYAVVGVVGGLALVSVIGAVVFLRRRQRRREAEPVVSSQSFESVEKPLKKEGGDDESQDFLESISSIAHSLKVYPFQQLKEATENFSPTCWIKGSVYRGTINGDFAAIKKMSGDVSKEITLLNKINHSNLIRLSGVSFNEGNWYLVYEYASNGALSDLIHSNGDDQEIMNWDKRLQIALDVAAGLNYLHRYTSPPHIHKDLNSSNVLLDGEFRAKIANFGLARAAEGQGDEFALTRHIVGTKGYMAPEYLENGVVSPKLDVYSFGVLLLEILTGKQVSTLYEEVNMQLPEILTPVLSEGGQENISKLMDPLLLGKYPPELALVLFRLIDGCLKKDPSARPNMDDIFQTLSRISGEWAVSISESSVVPR